MGKMTNMVKEVHGAIMDDDDEVPTSEEEDAVADLLVASASANINRLPSGEIFTPERHDKSRKSTKFDKLLSTMNPLNEVRDRKADTLFGYCLLGGAQARFSKIIQD